MLTNEQVIEAVEQVLKTFPTQYNADELETLITSTLKRMDNSYYPTMVINRPDDAPAHDSRRAAVMLRGPAGDTLSVWS